MMSRPAWKPHCDLEYISLLTCFMIRFKINIAKILPAMERREIPQWLSHTFLFPLFLYKWWIRTSLKSCGTIPCFQISMINSSNFFTSFVPLYLKISDGNTSFPSAFQDIICSIAARTPWKFDKNDNSSISGCWGLDSRTSSSVEDVLLRTVCSFHLFKILALSVKSVILHFPVDQTLSSYLHWMLWSLFYRKLSGDRLSVETTKFLLPRLNKNFAIRPHRCSHSKNWHNAMKKNDGIKVTSNWYGFFTPHAIFQIMFCFVVKYYFI